MEPLTVGRTINDTIRYYCTANKYRLIAFVGKVPINDEMKHIYDFAIKTIICNIATEGTEVHIFCGKRAKIKGYYLLSDIRAS